MMLKHTILTALLLAFSLLAFGQEQPAPQTTAPQTTAPQTTAQQTTVAQPTAVVQPTAMPSQTAPPMHNSDTLFFCIACIAVVLLIALLCTLMLRFNRILMELREKLTFSASTADNGKAAVGAINQLDAQIESLRKEIFAQKSSGKNHAQDTTALSADEIAAKVTASKPFRDMTSEVTRCCDEFNKLGNTVEQKCSETIANAAKSLSQASGEIASFSQRLNSFNESLATAPDKAHTLVESELDKAKTFFSDALRRIENASSSIASVGSQLACLQELTSRTTQISDAVGEAEKRNADLAENVAIVRKGLSDMSDGLARFREFSAQIPAAAIAQSNLAESKALLKAKTDELEATARQLADLKSKADTDEAKLRVLEDEKSTLQTKNEALLKTLEEAEKRLEETVALAESRGNEYNALKGQYDGITKRLGVLDAKKREAEGANATLKERTASLSAELEAAKRQSADAVAALQEIKPAYDIMLADRSGLYPQGLDAAPYNTALQELEKLAKDGSANAELCLRDLALVNTFLKQEGAVTKDAQEQMLRVLWYFSKNFTAAMKSAGVTPSDSCSRLNVWLSFFLEMKDEGFALEMPSIGDGVTLSWMTPGVPGTNTVSAVESWAVYAEGNSSPTYKALVR